MKRDVKLYNVIFPIWMLLALPMAWLVIMPANFIIDTAVLLITLKVMKVENIKEIWKKSIVKVWIFGFISDIVGGLFMFWVIIDPILYDYLKGVAYNPFKDVLSFLWVVLCMAIASVCIYFLNYKISLKKTTLTNIQKKKLALSLAIATSPYLFLLPTSWFY